MNIYEIDSAILALIDPETGEVLDNEAFDALQMERDEKIENIACWMKNTDAEAKAIRNEELELAKRRKALENRVDRLKAYLGYALNGVKFSTAKCSVSFRNTQSVDVTDAEAAIAWARSNGHQECIKETAPTISKSELAKVLKDGVEVPGAQLVQSLSVGVK